MGDGLSEAIRALPGPDRDALAVLALAFRPVSLDEWSRLLARTDLSTSRAGMSRLCERGVRKGLLEERGQLYATTAEQALEHLGDAQTRGRLTALERAVRRSRSASSSRRYGGPEQGWELAGSALRVALVQDDGEAVREALSRVPRAGSREQRGAFLATTLGVSPDDRWFDRLGADGELYLETLVDGALEQLWPLSDVVLERAKTSLVARGVSGQLLGMRGAVDDALALDRMSARARFEVALTSAFWAGRRPQAFEIGQEAVDTLSKRGEERPLTGVAGVLHALARVVIAHERPAEWEGLARVLAADSPRRGFPSAYRCLDSLHQAATRGGKLDVGPLRHASGAFGALQEDGWVSALVAGLVNAWLEVPDPDRGLVEALEGWRGRAHDNGYAPVAEELAALLAALRGETPPDDTLAAAYRPRQPWEIALDSLATIAEEATAPPVPERRTRVAWEVTLGDPVEVRARLIEGERARRGRPIALERLLDGDVPGLSESDRRVLAHVRYEEPSYFSKRNTRKPSLGARALLGLVDHPSVMEPDGSPLVITRGEPGVQVRSTDRGLSLSVKPEAMRTADIAWEEQSRGHVVVYERTEAVERVARVLAKGRIVIPERGRERLGEVLSQLGARLPIDASGEVPIEGEERPADPRPLVLLEWTGERLIARVRVGPLGIGGPTPEAGEGDAQLATIVDGQALRTERDLTDEVVRRDELLDECPTLAGLDEERGMRQSEDLAEALEVMLELAAVGDRVVLAWPRGPRLSAPVERASDALRVRVRSASDWLSVDVSMPVDEERVLEFKELLELPRRGRFVEIENGSFVALTRELADRIDALAGIGAPGGRGAKGLKVSPALLPLIDELTHAAGERTIDAEATERLERLLALADYRPDLPEAFDGELRDYQQTGFQWMMRLAEAELGGCLADDMGLGKTVQTLGLLLARSARGPALVVAPASVATNWVDEAERFTPSLRFANLRDGDRERTVRELGPGDVLVCTYGLLVSEADRLAGVDFDTVVFDEGHYLKNHRTKRARAAHALKARFRLALTGTPLENHLGELWSLFRAVTPGLLGPKKRFEQRYGSLAKQGDAERAGHLKRLLRPFLLRRTKSQVAKELPERTEITLRVTPTEDERAFYEALRRQALERLAVPDAASRMQVLAEILRLRQAAIDPRLVDPADGPPGAKLDALVDRLVSLKEEGHRALVFSQFLGSLERVRAGLDAAGLRYLALEGSTPAKERARRIAEFQEGETDVFVMSLKAGGIGVNLTAADYVIHLDPWWNPAVEDQATGRAHRIGQRRPVTVYRLITEGTIEEKILALHHEKRQMAEDLLSGLERSTSLDLEQLRALLE